MSSIQYALNTMVLLCSCGFAWAQKYTPLIKSKKEPICHYIINVPDACKWEFFRVADTIRGTVLEFAAAKGACVWNLHAGVCVLRTEEGDTIRVLMPCLDFEFARNCGDDISIVCVDEPTGWTSLAKNQSNYDGVTKTTWAMPVSNGERVYFPFENCHHIYTNSYCCKWKIWKTEGTLIGEVIRFDKMTRRCGVEFGAAVVILKTKADTLRALLCCYTGMLKVGSTVKLTLTSVPTFDVGIPQDVTFSQEQRAMGMEMIRLNEFDSIVEKTVFAVVME